MSAIGDYVHLTAAGYLASGTGRPHWNRPTTAASAFNRVRAAVRSKVRGYGRMDKRVMHSLESQMNKIVTSVVEQKAFKNSPDPKATEQKIKDTIQAEMSQIENIQMDRLAVDKLLPPMTKIPNQYATYKNWQQQIISKVSTLNAAIAQAQKMLDNPKGADGKILSNLATKIENMLNVTYEQTYAKITQIDGGYIYKKSPAVKSLVRKLNDLITEYNQMTIIDNHENLLLKSIMEVLPTVSDLKVEKTLENMFNPDDHSYTIKHNKIVTKAPTTKKNKLGDVEQLIISKDGSMEVQFKWRNKKDLSTAKINNLNVSSSRKFNFADMGIEISLADLLAKLPSDDDFANHFYNAFTQHQDKSAGALNWYRRQGLEVVKLLAIYKAFDNDAFNKDKMFIYTVDGKTIQVISTRDLLQILTNPNNGRYRKSTHVQVNGENINRMNLLYNKKGPEITGESRIRQMLTDAHSRKIMVAIENSALSAAYRKR